MQKLFAAVSRSVPKPGSLFSALKLRRATAASPQPLINNNNNQNNTISTATDNNSKMGSIPQAATPTKGGNADGFLSLVQSRRTYYALNKTLPISSDRVQTIVTESLQHVPSSFNSQSNRVVVLFGAEHDKLWDITTDILKPLVPAEQWENTAKKMAAFKGGAGTVLFFEDQATVKELQEKFALYAAQYVLTPLLFFSLIIFFFLFLSFPPSLSLSPIPSPPPFTSQQYNSLFQKLL